MASRRVLRRSPGLVVYWRNGQLVVENYLTKQRRTVGPGVVEVLNHFHRWRSPADVLKRYSGRTREEVRSLIRALTAGSFLRARGRESSDSGSGLGSWEPWHPAASFFHFSTRDPVFATTTRTRAAMEGDLRARTASRPLPVKRYRGIPSVALPQPTIAGEFPRALLDRRTWRRFGSGPIDLPSLSNLLALSFGAQWKVTLEMVGPMLLTTSPSGGARHPLETYLIVQDVTGLAPGVYHYQIDRHRLTRIRPKLTRRRIRACFPAQNWCATAPVVVVLSAVFARTQWKYQHPRAYRVLLAEAGHVCQTFCLTATWLDLAPFCTMAVADSSIDRSLGLDGLNESVIYVAGVGRRPRGKRWAPWPGRSHVPLARPTGVFPQELLR